MNARGLMAIGVLAAWGGGIAVFVQRESSRSPRERLAEAAMRVAPGATYFAVERGGKHVGFASSTTDTVPGGLQVTEYFVADVDDGGTGVKRWTAQSIVHLSRGLALRDFTITFGAGRSTTIASGRTLGDTLLAYEVRRPGAGNDSSRVSLTGPLLLPTLVPLALALGRTPRVGATYEVDTFDPASMTKRPMAVSVTAESLFVLVDSAAFDPKTQRWLGAHSDTVRGWRVSAKGGDVDSWVDEVGRMIAIRAPAGFAMRRTAYEMAFENWRTASPLARDRRAVRGDSAEHHPSAITAGVSLTSSPLASLRVRLGAMDLSRLQLHGGAQLLSGDTVTLTRDDPQMLRASFPLPPSEVVKRRFARELRAEPFLEIDNPSIVALAKRLKAGDADPRIVVERIAAWVHDSLAKEPTQAPPSALTTLSSRSGDSDEHAMLFVALARSAGIPARVVSGLLYLNGTFYYHAWGEVLLQRWIPIDPTLGQVPADAGHVRMVVGGVGVEMELRRMVDRIDLQVVGK